MANVINSLKYNNGNAFIFALPFGSCTVGGNVQKKDITIDGISVIEEGLMIAVKFSNANTAASPTLSINSSAASPIYYKGSAIPTNAISAGATYQFIYNGTQWELIGDLDTSAAITVTTSGSGNAITSLSVSGGTITATKGSTFLTAHPTISTSTDSTSTASPSHGGTFTAVDSVTRDSNGHVTKVNTKTITLPSAASSSDTKVTNTLATTTKAYLTGTTSSSTNTGTQVFDTGVYLGTTAGELNAKSFIASNEISVGRKSDSTVGFKSIAVGRNVEASGYYSCALGDKAVASEASACAIGNNVIAKGFHSFVQGIGAIASSNYQHVFGKYNVEDSSGTYAHILGGGSSDTNRKNIHTVDWQGNAEFAGDVKSTDSTGNYVSLNNIADIANNTKKSLLVRSQSQFFTRDVGNLREIFCAAPKTISGTHSTSTGTYFSQVTIRLPDEIHAGTDLYMNVQATVQSTGLFNVTFVSYVPDTKTLTFHVGSWANFTNANITLHVYIRLPLL